MMTHPGSRRGAANLAVPLMIVAFLAIAGFLWWLSVNTEDAGSAMAETPDTAEVEDDPTATQVTAADLEGSAANYEGQRVRARDLTVASRIGDHAFWVELPSGNPFLVRMQPSLVEEDSVRVEYQSTVNLTGTLHAMSDSVITDWSESGIINENQQLEVEFASHFIEADRVRTGSGSGGGGGEGGQGEGGESGGGEQGGG